MGRFCIIEGGLQMESRLGACFAPDRLLKNIELVVSKRPASCSVVLHMTRASLLCDAQFWNYRQAAWHLLQLCGAQQEGRATEDLHVSCASLHSVHRTHIVLARHMIQASCS